MIPEEQLIAWLSGDLAGAEKARFEEQLARDPEALRLLVEQEKMDAALTMLLARPERARVRESILAVVRGPAGAEVKTGIHNRVAFETRHRTDPSRAGVWEWIKAWPVPLKLAALTALALLCFVLGQPPKKTDFAQPPGANEFPELPPKLARDPVAWPFAANSPWNTPIGSNARYAEPVGLDLGSGAVMVDAQGAHPLHRATAGDPVGEIYEQGSATPLATTRLPVSRLPTADQRFAVVSADARTLYEIEWGHVEGNRLIAGRVIVADLTGSGIPPDHHAPTLSGLSDYAGSLCAADFTGPIRRALGAVFDATALAVRADGSAHTWPAPFTPRNLAAQMGGLNPDGNIFMGSLLAIPPDVDLTQIGVGDSGPAFEIARALQDYGVYLKRPFAGQTPAALDPGRRAPLIFCGDLSAVNLPPGFAQQLAMVASHLKVVINNDANNIGGGGKPRQPSAPAF